MKICNNYIFQQKKDPYSILKNNKWLLKELKHNTRLGCHDVGGIPNEEIYNKNDIYI